MNNDIFNYEPISSFDMTYLPFGNNNPIIKAKILFKDGKMIDDIKVYLNIEGHDIYETFISIDITSDNAINYSEGCRITLNKVINELIASSLPFSPYTDDEKGIIINGLAEVSGK